MNERQRILKQIDDLNTERCRKCIGSDGYGGSMRCNCKAAVKIRKLGDELIALTAKKRQAVISEKIKEIRKAGITVEGYRELREFEMTNVQIVKALGIPANKFYKWKTEALNGKKTEAPKMSARQTRDYKERQKWREVAIQNGIKEKTYNRRIEKGHSYEDAATMPLAKPSYNVEDSWTASLNGISKEVYRHRVRSGWPSEHACRAPKGTRLEQWLEEREGVKS